VGKEPVAERGLDPDVEVELALRALPLERLRHSSACPPTQHRRYHPAALLLELEAGERVVGGANLDAVVVELRREVVEMDRRPPTLVEEAQVEAEVVQKKRFVASRRSRSGGDEIKGEQGGGVDSRVEIEWAEVDEPADEGGK